MKHKQVITKFLQENLTVNQVQYYLSCGISLHPLLYGYFIETLAEMDNKGTVSMLPIAILQNYNNKLKKIA